MAHEIRRCRTFRYRLHPTFRQTQALNRQLDYRRELYNAALEERVGARSGSGARSATSTSVVP